MAEVAAAEQLEPNQLKDGLRLITAFGQIGDTQTRKKLVALIESMVPDANSQDA